MTAIDVAAAAAAGPPTPRAGALRRLRRRPGDRPASWSRAVRPAGDRSRRWSRPYDPAANDFSAVLQAPVRPPTCSGTDDLGRDVFSRVIYGARASLQAGVLATLLALVVAVPLGLWPATTAAGATRSSCASPTCMLAFPFLIIAVGLAAILGPSLQQRDDRPRRRRDPQARAGHPRARCSALREQDVRPRGGRRRRRRPDDPVAATSCRTWPGRCSSRRRCRSRPRSSARPCCRSSASACSRRRRRGASMLSAAQPFLSHRAVARDLARPGDLRSRRCRSTCSATACATSSTRGRSDERRLPLSVRRRSRSASTHATTAPVQAVDRRLVRRSTRGEVARDRRRVGLRQERDRRCRILGLLPAGGEHVRASAARRRATCVGAPRASCGDIRGSDDLVRLPGADDLAEPGVHRRPPDRRGARAGTSGCRRREARDADRSSCSTSSASPSPDAAGRRVPAPALRRHAPARDDRDGDRVRAEGPDRRRADDRARRDDPGGDPRRPAATCASASGMAIVLITHDLGVVADIADRVVVMYAGRKVEEAPVDELFAAPAAPVHDRACWRGAADRRRGLPATDGNGARLASGDPAALGADACPRPAARPLPVRRRAARGPTTAAAPRCRRSSRSRPGTSSPASTRASTTTRRSGPA